MELKTRKVRWLEAPPDVVLSGIDGLYRVGRSLVAVQTGVAPPRAVALALDERGLRIRSLRTLERGGALSEPTHGTPTPDGFVFIAQSGWAHRLLPPEQREKTPSSAPRLAIVKLP